MSQNYRQKKSGVSPLFHALSQIVMKKETAIFIKKGSILNLRILPFR